MVRKVFIDNTISKFYISDPSRGYARDYANSVNITWKGIDYRFDKIMYLLRIIDLSSNKLTGKIPVELNNLVELVQLNLSRNNLGGIIPEKIGELKSLESLDLSHNQLSGKIPKGLASISTLAYLDLSDNHLRGAIPTGTQLQSFEACKYSGNSGLCGPPLPNTCSDNSGRGTTSATATEERRNSSSYSEWFAMSWYGMGIGVGFCIGFLGGLRYLTLEKWL